MWYMIRNLRCTVTIDSVLANSNTQNAFLFTVNAIFLHDYPLAVEPGSTPRPLVQKKTWRDSLPVDMLLSAVSVLVVAQSSSEIPEGLMNNPVLLYTRQRPTASLLLGRSLSQTRDSGVSQPLLCFHMLKHAYLHTPTNSDYIYKHM